MNDTTPRITLDRESVPVGGHVTGRVSGARDAETLAAQLLWRTSGECMPEEQVVAEEALSPQGGEAPFSLDVPAAGPMSYAGRSFSIAWVVRVNTTAPVEHPLTVTAAD